MFERSAEIYDKIYSFKDYEAEALLIRELIHEHSPSAKTLLDAACGTGKHLAFLRQDFECTGFDLDEGLLAIARERHPEVEFVIADMTEFELGRNFDAITCLFSAIGYTKTVDRLQMAIERFAAHLTPRGVLIVEPWLTPDAFTPRHIGALFIDEPELKIARMNTVSVEGNVSVLDFRYLIGTPDGIRVENELHELGLFTVEEHLEAFGRAGLEVEHREEGLSGRGIYIVRHRNE